MKTQKLALVILLLFGASAFAQDVVMATSDDLKEFDHLLEKSDKSAMAKGKQPTSDKPNARMQFNGPPNGAFPPPPGRPQGGPPQPPDLNGHPQPPPQGAAAPHPPATH